MQALLECEKIAMSSINIPPNSKSYFIAQNLSNSNRNIILACASEEEAILTYRQSQFFNNSHHKPLYLPSFDTSPYDKISPSCNILSARSQTLSYLADNAHNKLLVTNIINLAQLLPPVDVLVSTSLKIYQGMNFSVNQLLNFLNHNGFLRNTIAVDSGEYAARGEIIDIVLGKEEAYRINFKWNVIDSIKKYDISNQMSQEVCTTLDLCSASELILRQDTIENFKNNFLTTFGIKYTNQNIYQSVIEGKKFPSIEYLFPLFFRSLASIFDYMNDSIIIYDIAALKTLQEYEQSYLELYQARLQSNKISTNDFYPVLPPDRLYISSEDINKILKRSENISIDITSNLENTSYPRSLKFINYETTNDDQQIAVKTPALDRNDKIKLLFDLINKSPDKIIIIFCASLSGYEKLKNIISFFNHQWHEIRQLSQAQRKSVNITRLDLQTGFYNQEYLFITEQDFFGAKSASSSVRSSAHRFKNLLTELDTLKPYDYVVHVDHGIGQFIAIETISVKNIPHDCVKLVYADNDRLYVPVENIGTIKKYGNFEAQLDKLGNLSWQRRKSKLKNRVNDIAAELIKIAAERKLALNIPIDYDATAYDKFCAKFAYVETEDQIRAIEDVKEDLLSERLMDRLVCGDVGFGKTEIAMRAAFMVAANKNQPSQVAIIVPTTILCKQHFTRFVERFTDSGFNVAQLSSLVTKKEAKSTKDALKNGTVKIIIGTHALLAKDIEFNNLALLIIDEEQHFGVSQKELLKKLKSQVHVLSLSATPIPRTMQMSLSGLKDLTVVASAPINRLAVKTTIMNFDSEIVKDALIKEYNRGGKSFYVCPRIKDIADVEKYLQIMTPLLKYKIAHGQLSPMKIDEIMYEFNENKFDILISTTIIESGIDIPTANTIIVHKADKLGLSQLYQLRGRVGRSNIRGYAYLTLSNDKKISKEASRRIEVMQNIDSLGAGFMVASHDMDNRGFGNLIGEEQSGQIKEVGIELFQEMLQEEMTNIKLENSNLTERPTSTTINLNLPVLISNDYIGDSSLRLGIYKRIGNLEDTEQVQDFRDEMIDRFGPIPKEFNNLLEIIKIKLKCQNLKIDSLDSGDQGFVLKFHDNANISDKLMSLATQYPNSFKIKPDNKMIFIKPLNEANIIDEAERLMDLLISI